MILVERHADNPMLVRNLLRTVAWPLFVPIICMSTVLLLVNYCAFFAIPAIGRSMLLLSLALGFIPIGTNGRLSIWLRCLVGLLYVAVGVPFLYTYSLLFMGLVFNDWL